MMKLGTFCSGIGAPEVAARGMFEPIWFSEIEPFPCAVLAHHWPSVPNLGDMTATDLVDRIARTGLPDVVVAGLPCQPFSVAGLRKGEADPRNLTARFVEIADAIDDLRRDAGQPPVWWLVENVPGLLSDRGNAFGALLGGMVGSSSALIPSGRWESAGVADGPRRCAAWRVLDAQFFGVAQRRKRVFALFVAGAGKWRCADALLPIIDSMSWHSPPRRETGQRSTPTIGARTKGGGGLGTDFNCDVGLIPHCADIASTLNAAFGSKLGLEDQHINAGAPLFVAHTLKGEGFDASEDGTGRQNLIPEVAGTMKACRDSGGWTNSADHAAAGYMVPVSFGAQNSAAQGDGVSIGYSPPLDKSKTPGVAYAIQAVAQPWAVRRLTPTECERLQGFPDDHTAVKHRGKPAADGPRYKALGNSMAVPVISYILERMHISMTGQAPQEDT